MATVRRWISIEYDMLEKGDFGSANPWPWLLDHLFHVMRNLAPNAVGEPWLYSEDWHHNPYRADPVNVAPWWDRETLLLVGEIEVTDAP